jgi:hypothetical protein
MKRLFLIGLLIIRLIANEGVFLNARRIPPKRQPTEVFRFIRRPAKKGKKKGEPFR